MHLFSVLCLPHFDDVVGTARRNGVANRIEGKTSGLLLVRGNFVLYLPWYLDILERRGSLEVLGLDELVEVEITCAREHLLSFLLLHLLLLGHLLQVSFKH